MIVYRSITSPLRALELLPAVGMSSEVVLGALFTPLRREASTL